MALSEKFINEKMLEVERRRYEVERCRLDVETKKLKALLDIRDVMLMINGMIGIEVETRAKNASYSQKDVDRIGDELVEIKERIEKRWSE